MEIVEINGTVTLTVRVVPRASKSEIAGEHDGALKVRIASPPVDGAANDELVRLLSKVLKVSKSDVVITAGQTSKTKHIRITGITAAQADAILNVKT